MSAFTSQGGLRPTGIFSRFMGLRPAGYGPDSPALAAASILGAARRLEQEPDAPLRLVDPVLEEARGGDVAVLVANGVRLAHEGGEPHIVVAKLGEHVGRSHEISVVVE